MLRKWLALAILAATLAAVIAPVSPLSARAQAPAGEITIALSNDPR